MKKWTTTDVAKLHKDIKSANLGRKTLNPMQLAYIKLRTLQTKSKELKELELIIELKPTYATNEDE